MLKQVRVTHLKQPFVEPLLQKDLLPWSLGGFHLQQRKFDDSILSAIATVPLPWFCETVVTIISLAMLTCGSLVLNSRKSRPASCFSILLPINFIDLIPVYLSFSLLFFIHILSHTVTLYVLVTSLHALDKISLKIPRAPENGGVFIFSKTFTRKSLIHMTLFSKGPPATHLLISLLWVTNPHRTPLFI